MWRSAMEDDLNAPRHPVELASKPQRAMDVGSCLRLPFFQEGRGRDRLWPGLQQTCGQDLRRGTAVPAHELIKDDLDESFSQLISFFADGCEYPEGAIPQ